MLRLEDTKLYKVLVDRKTGNSKYYSSFLNPLEKDMSVLLECIKNQYSDFPDHGLQHSLRIIEYIGKLLNDAQINKITDMEIFVFILSALFHDTGMTLYNSIEKKERKRHHCHAKKVIDLYFDKCLMNLDNKDRIKEVVTFVCYAHGLLLGDLTSEKHFLRKDTISYDNVRYNLLAYLLRIGDLMDLEGERVNNFRMIMYSDSFTELAYNHNKRHQNVKLFNFSDNEMNIEVEAENIQQYKIWHEWFGFLKEDILSANTVLKETQIAFPLPETKIITSNGEMFDIQELRFEIDEKGGIWDIISKSIYTNELDFVRELVQNAIDATLKKIYINDKIELENASPRSWEMYNSKPILVCYSEKRRKLYVADQGIGMDKDDLCCFLFKVSSTGHVGRSNRKFDFPGIAQYGIGFVSCLINAEKIQVYTSKKGESSIHHVTMESNLNVAFVQNIANSREFEGTIIELDLKHFFSNKDIEEYLRKTFYCTSVKIKYSNLDMVEKVTNNLFGSEKYEETLENPYLLSDFIFKIKADVDENIMPLLKQREKIVQYEKRINALNKFLEEQYYKKSWKNKLADYNQQVECLKNDAPSNELKKDFPNITLDVKQKSNDEHILSEITNEIAEFGLKIASEKGKYDNQIDKIRLEIKKVSSQQITIGDEWRYFVLLFNSEFEIEEIQYSSDPIKLSGKTGIILFKHSGQDFQHGIEYVAINGFLFMDGKICNRLARFSRYSESEYYPVVPRSFVVGLDGNYDDVREEVQEYFDNLLYDDETSKNYFDDSYNSNTQIDAEYDVIYISENNYVRSNNQNVFRVRCFLDEEYDEKISLYDELIETNKKGRERNIDVGVLELERCIINARNQYYQDGIAISSKIDNLFPIGLFRIVCNCTADARMKLNVTRHELSEIRADVDAWMDNTGVKIQEMILDSLLDMLEKADIYVEFENVISQDDKNDYFSQLSYKKIRGILNNRNLK